VFKSKLMRSAVVAVMTTFAISSTIQSAPAATSTIEMHISGDINIQKLWETIIIPAFEKQYPDYKVNVTFDRNGLRESQLIARITAAKATRRDPQVDIIEGSGAILTLASGNLLYRPSPTLIPNLKNVNKLLVKQAQGGIPYRASTVMLAYNSQKVTKVPKTLDELLAWIKANPGKFSYNVPSGGGSGNSFVQTVVDMNLTPEERVRMSLVEDKEIQKKWAKGLETLRDLNKYTYGKNGTYPANNVATLTLLGTGEIDMGTVWSDMFASAKAAGTMPAYMKATAIKSPSLTGGPAILGIPINGKNRAGARLLANFALTPAMQNEIMGGFLKGIPVINGKLLDQTLFENFKDIDVTDMRAGYLAANNNELRSQWSLNVPGK
jgi:putative spermidine/putrescine transport system substrate-binding protein